MIGYTFIRSISIIRWTSLYKVEQPVLVVVCNLRFFLGSRRLLRMLDAHRPVRMQIVF